MQFIFLFLLFPTLIYPDYRSVHIHREVGYRSIYSGLYRLFISSRPGLERIIVFRGNIIHLAERVFRTGSFTPHLNFFIRRGSQRIKTVAVLTMAIIDFIDKGRYCYRPLPLSGGLPIKRYILCRSVHCRLYLHPCRAYHGEIMNGWFIAFFLSKTVRVFDKSPCAVRIIIQCKLLLPAVFLQYKAALEYAGFAPSGISMPAFISAPIL